jgi:DNA-binding GntR family transcriptional regulator
MSGAAVRHRRIADTLAEAIARGRYPVGSRLPTEAELSRRFESSRFTVRQALSALRGRGMIASRRGVGSLVVAARTRQSYVESFASIDGLMRHARGVPLRVETIADVIADASLAEALGCREGAEFLEITGWRFPRGQLRGAPLGWSQVHVQAQFGAIRTQLHRLGTSIAELIMARYGVAIARIDQELTAVALPAAIARRLGVVASGPALQLTRWYRAADGVAFEIARSVFPAGRYTHVSQIVPAPGAITASPTQDKRST